MKVTNPIAYDVSNSVARMDAILNTGDFYDCRHVPSRDSLTYTNGYYVYVTALFIDIVGSSSMTNDHYRPTLAKIYRCFISECTAIMNDKALGDLCKEINIHGDCVWGVFDTSSNKENINTVFNVAAELNTMIDALNYKLAQKVDEEISVGIGLDYGRALMVKAGYYHSGLNDVIWMGDVVNTASHLANAAGRNGLNPIIVSNNIYPMLNEHNKNLLRSVFINSDIHYQGNIIDSAMQNYFRASL